MAQLIEITSQEFLEKQKTYMLLRIEKGLQEIKDGKTTRYTMEELRQRMGL